MLLTAQISSYYTASNSYASLVLSKFPMCIHNTWEVWRALKKLSNLSKYDYYVRGNFKTN